MRKYSENNFRNENMFNISIYHALTNVKTICLFLLLFSEFDTPGYY